MLSLELQILLSAFILGTLATPLSDAGVPTGFSVPIRRPLSRQLPLADGVFDPTLAKAELRALEVKYTDANRILAGIGLTPLAEELENLSNTDDLVEESNINTSFSSVYAEPTAQQVPVTNYQNLLYYFPLSFGTPPQQMSIYLDTGSADLWVPVNCPTSQCPNRQFKPASSKTYKNEGVLFKVGYGSGKVSGTLANDTVSLGGSLSVPQQPFGAVSTSSGFNYYPNDGLMGLAFGTIAFSKKPTFFENLMINGQVSAPLFSVSLARLGQTGSSVCFGCYDKAKATGPVVWIPVQTKTYWAVPMTGVTASYGPNSINTVKTNLTAAIDTGTSLIYVPVAVATAFYKLIPGSKEAPQMGPGYYSFPCSSTLKVSLNFDGKTFAINMVDFNLGKIGSSTSKDCVGGIIGHTFSGLAANLAIIGYQVYDYSNGARVGLAPSSNRV